jgi:hypothetical protein
MGLRLLVHWICMLVRSLIHKV